MSLEKVLVEKLGAYDEKVLYNDEVKTEFIELLSMDVGEGYRLLL